MKGKLVVSALVAMVLVAGTGAALGQSERPVDKGFNQPTDISREDAIARVLAVDSRFAGLIDHDRLRREVAADFTAERYYTDSFYRVLGPWWAELDGWHMSLRDPLGWLIEVNLVTGCPEVELADADLPIDDPCAWRHTWVYLVEPDGVVTPVVEAGDPDGAT